MSWKLCLTWMSCGHCLRFTLLGNFRSGTRQFCDAAGSNFSQKKRPAHAHAYRFTASRGVEDVSQRDLASCRKRE